MRTREEVEREKRKLEQERLKKLAEEEARRVRKEHETLYQFRHVSVMFMIFNSIVSLQTAHKEGEGVLNSA